MSNPSPIHPFIGLFAQRAEILDIQNSKPGVAIDGAMAKLAAWMTLASDHLTEDDLAVLGDIGAMLYREGLRGRTESKKESQNRPPNQ